MLTGKIFAGILINSEIRMYLRQSSPFEKLQIVTHKQHDYIGYYPPEGQTVAQLKEIQQLILSELALLCPKLEGRAFELTLFPQVFIA